MPAESSAIVTWLDELLDVGAFTDLGPNGLQVPGSDRVGKVVTVVSAHLEAFERARAAGAQLVLAHHGILWDFHPRRIDHRQARRLHVLLDAGLGLAQYHLPLDAHPEVGNNALIADGLGCVAEGRIPFGSHRGREVGIAARFPGGGVEPAELTRRVRSLTDREPLVFDAGGPARVQSIGIVSGSAASSLDEAYGLGLDAFLTGEPAEHVMADAREAGLHFYAAGHYATETFGIRRVGELVAERFDVEHEFLFLPNPV